MPVTQLTPGTTLEPAAYTFSSVDLFLFSAAGWHPHRVHYDQDYTRNEEGHENLLVHGPLQAVHIFQNLTDQLPEGAELVRATYRHMAPLLIGVPSTARAEMSSVDEEAGTVEVEVWMERTESGERTTAGSAIVRTATS